MHLVEPCRKTQLIYGIQYSYKDSIHVYSTEPSFVIFDIGCFIILELYKLIYDHSLG